MASANRIKLVDEPEVVSQYHASKSFFESTQNVMGSKERRYYQDEIMRLSRELEHEKQLTRSVSMMELEFEKSMRICLEQEHEISKLRLDLKFESEKSAR